MRSQFIRRITISLVALLALSLCFDELSAQQRRRPRRSRRVTNPVVTQPVAPPTAASTQSTEPQIISTADQQASEQSGVPEVSGQVPASPRRTTTRRRASEPEDEEDSVRRTVNDLSSQVTKLSDKLSAIEQQQRTLVDMERLSRAEVRAETLRTQLRDVQEKEGMLQARLEQIDYNLKPENIDRSVSTFGSTRPEDARETRRRMLESDKTRTQAQLELYATSRQRLETAIINADLEVDKLRRRIEEADDSQLRAETPQRRTPTDSETNDLEGTQTTNPPATNSSTPPPR
jgi:chromosome segregation ATPase